MEASMMVAIFFTILLTFGVLFSSVQQAETRSPEIFRPPCCGSDAECQQIRPCTFCYPTLHVCLCLKRDCSG
ncbi:hypothetical protein SLEP1_g36552 [Rubroshorea leprosula]|uniref:Uncharacterized protein n=1 Tax=Rubroshorea leprosula TaxID=152421 RepID=A0AAV5KS10_9ROSI|nr:hypothetical protein SLEP1_g36552 [Rubroshorea leprosula]